MVIVVVLPLAQLLVEQMDVVADAVLVEELVELLVVDPVRPLDLAVEMRRTRVDIDMPDVQAFDVGVEAGLEFGAIVGLNHADAERQATPDFVEELDGRPLIAGVIDLENPDPRAIVNRRELIEAGPAPRDSLEKLHVELQPVAGLGLLVAFPAGRVRSMFLIDRQPVQAVLAQNAVNGRRGD